MQTLNAAVPRHAAMRGVLQRDGVFVVGAPPEAAAPEGGGSDEGSEDRTRHSGKAVDVARARQLLVDGAEGSQKSAQLSLALNSCLRTLALPIRAVPCLYTTGLDADASEPPRSRLS